MNKAETHLSSSIYPDSDVSLVICTDEPAMSSEPDAGNQSVMPGQGLLDAPIVWILTSCLP